MSESEIYDNTDRVIETQDGFRDAGPEDPSAIDSEIDFDDESHQDAELINEETAGNAEGDADAHLDDPLEVADDSTW